MGLLKLSVDMNTSTFKGKTPPPAAAATTTTAKTNAYRS